MKAFQVFPPSVVARILASAEPPVADPGVGQSLSGDTGATGCERELSGLSCRQLIADVTPVLPVESLARRETAVHGIADGVPVRRGVRASSVRGAEESEQASVTAARDPVAPRKARRGRAM